MQFGREFFIRLLPPRKLFLGKHTHLIHIVKHTVGLHPMKTGNRSVQVLHHLHRLVDITIWLGHTIDGITALHGLDTWQTHLLAIEHETFAHHFEFTNAKVIAQGIATWNGKREVVEAGMVEMPKLGISNADGS